MTEDLAVEARFTTNDSHTCQPDTAAVNGPLLQGARLIRFERGRSSRSPCRDAGRMGGGGPPQALSGRRRLRHARRRDTLAGFYPEEAEPLDLLAPPEHGGRLRQAAERFGIPLTDWLDLSTGINPRAWPVPALPASLWSRLPETDDGLERAASDYYGASEPLPLAGSQAAIQLIPKLRPPGRVGVPEVGYAEHAHAWRCAGHEVVPLPDGDAAPWLDVGPERLDCVVVINPNNPTGRRWSPETLLDWHARLAARGGWLVVDEAFMDATPESSVMPHAGRPGLILLRSFGKFFGLAGARVGFLFAEAQIRRRVAHGLGPWTLTGPSRWVAARALEDTAWYAQTAARLARDSERLAALLRDQGLTPSGGTSLFQWVETIHAERIYVGLAARGILIRLFAHPKSLRFGLPGEDGEWQRLAKALASLSEQGESTQVQASAAWSAHADSPAPRP